jgi:methionyl aminopeptidase
MNNILNENEIKLIKICGTILRDSLLEVKNNVKAGISTKFLDEIAEKAIVSRGAIPSFKGYEVEGAGKFPAALCVSINEEVVHGIPRNNRIIKEGDVVSLDLGAGYKGIYTDMALTVAVGKVSERIQELIETTELSLKLGIESAKTGNRIVSIGNAVQTEAENHGFGVVRDLVGHGIGKKPHLPPHIPNYGDTNDGPTITEGMALAIEPMITEGGYQVVSGKDGWTISTKDKSCSAHFEHTIIIENGLPVVVT